MSDADVAVLKPLSDVGVAGVGHRAVVRCRRSRLGVAVIAGADPVSDAEEAG